MSGALSAMIAAAFAGGGAAVSDPYFEYTTLLLPGNGTNGAQNNTFLDASTNNFTITRNGNTTQGTFSPFSQTGWGNYFNGSSYLSAGTTLFNYTTGNASTTTFTIEAFVYLTSYQTAANIYHSPSIISKGDVYLNLGVNGSGNLIFYHYDGTVRSITGSTVIPLNTWTYVAVTVTGGTATIYVNGSSVGSGTWYGIQSAGQNTTSLIGRASTNASSLYFNGYMSNLRVSTVARTITTPTVAYTNDANTALLTAQSNRFVDNSSSPITLTLTGSPSVQAFSPFNPSASWSAATYGGSGYFDDSNDYLSYNTSNSNFAIGATDNFCVEAWVYYTSSPNYEGFFQADYSAGLSNCLWFGYNSGTLTLGRHASTNFATYTVTFTQGQWYHVVGVRQAGNVALFLNGTRVANSSSNTDTTTQNGFAVGVVYPSGYFGGYFGGTRFVRAASGTSMPYDPTQTSITVPTSPLTAVTGTQLLLNYTNAGIYDATSKNDLETVGNAQISTAINNPFGASTGVMAFDGAGDFLYEPSNQNFSFETGDFTIEFWLYMNAVTGVQIVYDNRPANGAYPSIYLNGNVLYYYANSANRITGSSLSTGVWYHIAVSRSGTNTRLFINGTQSGSTYVDSTNYLSGPLVVAAQYVGGSANNFANCYIGDLRITKGYARYTTSFTAPTAAFPTL